ncbi:MAG: hypothetical protein PHC28_09205 [Flavobacterium sp.]|uniref:hypothetical protein n=1 Tax=Flavobacterium sp. TaxID=239 RepID=UPI0026055E69|nr:hypothetical protein [Flavobacterium sp.]MDD5150646.1 hypothetical protein [Flavobacterium sp.]
MKKIFFLLVFSSLTINAQQMIQASEVTPAYLKILCAMSDIEVVEMKDNYLKINNAIDIYIDLDAENNFLLLNSSYSLSAKTTPKMALELVNRINSEVVFVRANYNEPKNRIEYSYYFWIKDGFVETSLLSAIEMYKTSLNYSLGKDKDLLIQ